MDFSWMMLFAAFGGGLFGAALGALPAFVFTGFATLVGVATALAGVEYDVLGNVAFGPVFGPHISFAGGVAAAAYAKRRGELGDGKDIIEPLASLATWDVLIVGGVFGSLGYLAQWGLSQVLTDLTDIVALVVMLSGMLARIVFGSTPLLGRVATEDGKGSRFDPSGDEVWVEYQQDWLQAGVLGLGSGFIAAFMALTILEANPDATTAATVIGFGISAASLVFLALGASFPVTHHMTISAAYAAIASGSLWVGVLAGVAGGLLGELASRLFLIHGDTHIDPPATAIWVMASLALVPVAL